MDRSNNTKEEWREYPENPDYSVSSEGKILGPNRLLSPSIRTYPNNLTHAIVCVRKAGGKKQTKTVASIVARTFLPKNDSKRPTVAFIDGNSLNYKASNLRWKDTEDYRKQGGIRH